MKNPQHWANVLADIVTPQGREEIAAMIQSDVLLAIHRRVIDWSLEGEPPPDAVAAYEHVAGELLKAARRSGASEPRLKLT